MHALIVTSDTHRLESCQIAFLEAGLQVTGSTSFRLAEICLRRSLVDVLVVDKGSVQDQYVDLLEMGEHRNSQMVSILLTGNVGYDSYALPRLHPSLSCVLGDDVSPELVAKMGLASLAEMSACPGYDAEPVLLNETVAAQPVFQSIRGTAAPVSALA